MLHHSNSRHQRNRGSRIKTLLKVTLLLGVAVWLVYQVKHSYDKKNEYLNGTDDQLSHDDRSMFQGRKERVGSHVVGKTVENIDAISNQEEEKGGETVFEKDNNSHDDDAGNAERSEAEEGLASRADGNQEAHGKDEDETAGHSSAAKHDAESNSSDAESNNEVRPVGDDVPQNNNAQDEIPGEVNRTPHEDEPQGDESATGDKINASSNGSDGDQAEKKEELESQADSEFLSEDTKAGTGDEHSAETLPDETGNIPAVHNEDPQNGASQNLGDASSVTFDASEHSNSKAVHIEVGSEHEGARTSSGTASGDTEKGNSVESNPSDGIFVEEKAGTESGGDEKGAETGAANEASGAAKEANPQEGNAAAEVRTEQAANTQTENSQKASAAEGANGSLEETKPVENQNDGSTNASSKGDQEDIKIETNTSANDEHNEHQSIDVSSGLSGRSNDSGPEQTGNAETQ